jgi:hypothetical protein
VARRLQRARGKSADELGRLAARLVLDGAWTDSLDAEVFKARYP